MNVEFLLYDVVVVSRWLSVAERRGTVITVLLLRSTSESRVKFKSPELPSLPPHVVPGLTDPETHVGGLRRREILGFKLFSLDISHKPWQTILRRYLNWIAPWEEKIVSWQYNSSKVSPQTNWKVLQEPKNTDIEHTKHICWSSRQNSSSFWPAEPRVCLIPSVIGPDCRSRADGGWIM